MRQEGYGFGGAHGHTARERTQVRGPDEWVEPDWPVVSSSKGGSKTDLPVLAGTGCWCGLTYGHDWPGRDAGAPHPR